MTIERWRMAASAIALVGVSACNDDSGGAVDAAGEFSDDMTEGEMADAVDRQLARTAASEDCTESTVMAKGMRVELAARELAEDDPARERYARMHDSMGEEIVAKRQAGASEKELLEVSCDGYDALLAEIDG